MRECGRLARREGGSNVNEAHDECVKHVIVIQRRFDIPARHGARDRIDVKADRISDSALRVRRVSADADPPVFVTVATCPNESSSSAVGLHAVHGVVCDGICRPVSLVVGIDEPRILDIGDGRRILICERRLNFDAESRSEQAHALVDEEPTRARKVRPCPAHGRRCGSGGGHGREAGRDDGRDTTALSERVPGPADRVPKHQCR